MRRIVFAALLALVTAAASATGLFDIVTKGATDRSVTVDIIDSTDGTPETTVVFNTSGIDLWYRREGAARTAVTEATLAALTTAHTDGGFLHVSDGTYRLDLPDAAFATGANYVDFGGTVTGMIVIGGRVRLVDTNLEVANIPANVVQFGGTNATTSGGRPEVNTTHAAGTAWGSGAITAGSIASDAFTAAKFASDVGTEFGTATWATTVRSLTIFDEDSTTIDINATPTGAAASVTAGVTVTTNNDKTGYALSAAGVDAIWDEAQSGHATAGTFGLFLDSAVSGVSTGGVSAADIADAVWDEDATGHQTQGSFGQAIGDPAADTDSIWALANTNLNATVSSRASQTSLDAVDDLVDTEVGAIKTKTDFLPSATAGAAGGVFIAGTNAATTVTTAFTTTFTGNLTGNVTGSIGSVATGGITNASFACTGGSFLILGVVDCGTAASASSTGLAMRTAAAMADDTAIGMSLLAQGSTQGYAQSRAVTDNALTGDALTVDTWTVTPSGTISYYLFGTAPSSGAGGGLTQADVRTAVGLASANLDTQLSGVQSDTDNIQTRIPASLVSGRIDASVGAMASNVLTASAVNADAFTAAKFASDVGTEFGTATWATTTRLLTAGTNIVLAKGTGVTGFNDLDAAGVRSAVGLATANLDTQIGTLATASALATVDTNVDDIEAALGTPTDFGSGTSTIAANLQDLADNGTAAFDRTTDSLQAIRDRGDAAWIGGGGGTADWTVDERAAMRTILGIPASGTTPEDPTDGILDDIRDAIAAGGSTNVTTIESVDATDAIDARIAAGLATYDPPTRAELTTDTNSVLTAVSDVPTNAELSTALGTADDAVITLIGAAGAGLSAIPWNASWDAEVQSEALDALNALTITEPAGKPSWGGSLASWVAWIGAWTRNEVQQSETTKTLRNDADSSAIVTCAVSDDGTTFQVSECSP